MPAGGLPLRIVLGRSDNLRTTPPTGQSSLIASWTKGDVTTEPEATNEDLTYPESATAAEEGGSYSSRRDEALEASVITADSLTTAADTLCLSECCGMKWRQSKKGQLWRRQILNEPEDLPIEGGQHAAGIGRR